MLDVLLESRAARTRRVGGTLTSAALHGALIAAAVALTVSPPARKPFDPIETVTTVFNPVPIPPVDPAPTTTTQAPRQTTDSWAPPTVRFADPKAPVVDVTPSVPATSIATEIGPGLPLAGVPGAPVGMSGPPGNIVDEHLVDRAPRMIGRAEPPIFPSALRASGKSGKVVVQFVVDTTGRAEMSEFRSIESSDPLFVESVRVALPRYRFSPGEAEGRKVRTLVQLPFDFTLVR